MNNRWLPVLLMILCLHLNEIKAQSLTAMSFNIRYENPYDGNNSWDNRKESVVKLFQYYAPGIFGIQEGMNQQVQYLMDHLTTYRYVGVGREDGQEKGEYSAVFYDTTQYRLIRHTTFWLSKHPEKVSVGWDAALERICTAGLFQHKDSGKYLWIFNTHFDHRGENARKKSAQLILEKIDELNPEKFPVILMGDFNATLDSEPIMILMSQLSESSSIAQKPLYGPVGTFNDFKPDNSVAECIDFIFSSGFSVVSCAHIDDKTNDNRCISDHYPVICRFQFP